MTPQDLIDQWRLHPSPEVGSCANQLAGWLREQEQIVTGLPPETLDDACHCGKYPEGEWAFGTRCPVIEHRARSGVRWRKSYLELEEEMRRLTAPAAENK
jgi:hypothetical protein